MAAWLRAVAAILPLLALGLGLNAREVELQLQRPRIFVRDAEAEEARGIGEEKTLIVDQGR